MPSNDWPTQYVAERPFINLFGRTFRIFDRGRLSFFVRQKLFKLKEAINVYADDSMRDIRLEIRARNVIDFSATYDIIDPTQETIVGSFRRKGFRSMVRDTWTILDANGVEIGTLEEDSALVALIRRVLTSLIPQTFYVSIHGNRAGIIKQRFNLFKIVYDVSLHSAHFDPRMGVAASILLMAIAPLLPAATTAAQATEACRSLVH